MNLIKSASLAGIACVVLMKASPVVAAKLNVATWGTNNSECGSVVKPCRTVSHAESMSAPNGTIVVHPGIYTNNVDIDVPGLKLESVAGRYGTIISALNSMDHVINILADKVRVGKKGKGFTLRGALSTGAAGINIDTTMMHKSIRIEHNRSTENSYGMRLSGEKLQVRNNSVRDVTLTGFFCIHCDKAQFRDNLADGAGFKGYYFEDSDNVTFQRNRSFNTSGDGMTILSDSYVARIRDNVFEYDTSDDGLNMGDAVGSLIQGNIFLENDDRGLELGQLTDTKDYTVKDNLALGNVSHGFSLTSHMNRSVRIDGNSSLQNDQSAIFLGPGANISSLRNNNTYGSGSGAGIENASGNDIQYSRHFFGNEIGPDTGLDSDRHDGIDDGGSAVTGSGASKMNAFKAKKAASLLH